MQLYFTARFAGRLSVDLYKGLVCLKLQLDQTLSIQTLFLCAAGCYVNPVFILSPY